MAAAVHQLLRQVGQASLPCTGRLMSVGAALVGHDPEASNQQTVEDREIAGEAAANGGNLVLMSLEWGIG